MTVTVAPLEESEFWECVSDVIRQAIVVAERTRIAVHLAHYGSDWAAAYWGMLRDLRVHGPLSITEMMQPRAASREWVRRMAAQLVHDGLADFIDNPNRRKSKLVRITGKGVAVDEQICADVRSFSLGLELTREQLASASAVLGEIDRSFRGLIEERQKSRQRARSAE